MPIQLPSVGQSLAALLAAAPTKDIPGALVKAILQIKGNPQH